MLFWLGAHQHLGWLTGNLSSSRVLRTIPLSDPFAVLQILATGRGLSATVLVGALIVLLFYLLVGGRSFCAWVCPLNMITDLAGWLRQRLGIRGQLRVAREARFWVMGMAIGALRPARGGGVRVAEPDRHVPSRADLRSRIRPALGRGDLPPRPLRVAPRLVRIPLPPRRLLLAGRTPLDPQDRIRFQSLRSLRRLPAGLSGAAGDPLRRDRGEGIHR